MAMDNGNGESHREKNPHYVPPSFELTDDLEGEAKLRETLERELPEFCAAVKTDVDVLTIHQDAFAAGYHLKEYILFGMAMKYAGLYGRAIQIIGTNRETC